MIKILDPINSTSEGLDLILNNYKQGNWKRKSKFTIIKETEKFNNINNVARIFENSDDGEIITLLSKNSRYQYSTWLLPNIDLREYRDIFSQVLFAVISKR